MNESLSELAPSPALSESHWWPHPDLAASPVITSSLPHAVTTLVHNHRYVPENVARCLNDVDNLPMSDAFHIQAVDAGDGIPCQAEMGITICSTGRVEEFQSPIFTTKGRGNNPTGLS